MNIFQHFFQCLQYRHLKTENKHDVCRGKDWIKKFCESLRDYAMKIINFNKNRMKLLIKKLQESYENVKFCDICREKFENN